MPVSHVSPSPEFCGDSESLQISGYKTTIENAYYDSQSHEVSIDLFASNDRYVHTLDIPVRAGDLPASFIPTIEWIKAHAPIQVVEDHLLSSNRQPRGTLN